MLNTSSRTNFLFSAQRVMHNFLPQFPGSIVTPQQQQQHSNVGAKASGSVVGVASNAEKDKDDDEEAATFSDLKAWATSKPTEKSDEEEEPLDEMAAAVKNKIAKIDKAKPARGEEEAIGNVRPRITTSAAPEVGTEPSDSEPVDLSTRNRDSTPPLSGSFTLTDDGRPVPAEMLECPVCGEEFEV